MLHITTAEEFLDAIGAVLAAKGAAKTVTPGYLSFDKSGSEKMGLFVLFGNMDKRIDLSRQTSAVVDYCAPDRPRFPPAVVCLVGAEGQ